MDIKWQTRPWQNLGHVCNTMSSWKGVTSTNSMTRSYMSIHGICLNYPSTSACSTWLSSDFKHYELLIELPILQFSTTDVVPEISAYQERWKSFESKIEVFLARYFSEFNWFKVFIWVVVKFIVCIHVYWLNKEYFKNKEEENCSFFTNLTQWISTLT